METIVSGLITAAASVIVAFIARMPAASPRPAGAAIHAPQKYFNASWVVVSVAVVVFSVLAPALIHHDLAGMAFFIIPVATLGLAVASPINPLSSASITLGLHAANIILGPLGNRLAGSAYDTQVFFKWWMGVAIAINAIVIALICWWRQRDADVEPSAAPVVTATSSMGDKLTELERLGKLRADGVLTQEEFDREKQRVLSR